MRSYISRNVRTTLITNVSTLNHSIMMNRLIHSIMMNDRGLGNPIMDMLWLALATAVRATTPAV